MGDAINFYDRSKGPYYTKNLHPINWRDEWSMSKRHKQHLVDRFGLNWDKDYKPYAHTGQYEFEGHRNYTGHRGNYTKQWYHYKRKPTQNELFFIDYHTGELPRKYYR